MSYQQEVFTLIAKLGGSQYKTVVDRTLCEYMGGLEGGIFLAQLLYWSDKGCGDWFYKTYAEWKDETFLSEYQVRKCGKHCEEMGFLETVLRKVNGAPTIHYRVDTEKFTDSILKFLRIHSEKTQNPFFENAESIDSEKFKNPTIYTKSTSENTTEGESAPAPATVLSPNERATKKVRVKSPHLEPKHFVDGYIPAGTGINAVEVYYERFSINQDAARLNAIKQDDLIRLCPDLAKLRDVVTAYSRTSFQLGNVQLILDWYREGIPEKNRTPAAASSGRMAPVEKGHAAALNLREKLIASGKEGILG